MLERQTYYDLLGVDYDASRAEIQAAYEHLLQVYRDNPEMLRQIKLGWAALRNARSRAAYDKRNNISRLRQVRQQLDRPPPTLVGDELDIPKTLVEEAEGLAIPKTRIAVDAEHAPDQQSVAQREGTDQVQPSSRLVFTVKIQPLVGKPWSRELEIGEYLIGRQDENGENQCDICLPDPDQFISRKHATLLVRPDGCFVRDEHSDNGTYVNGHLVPAGQIALLAPDDQIGIEGQILTVDIREVSGT